MKSVIKKNEPDKIYRGNDEYWSQSSVKEFSSNESPEHFFKRNLCPNRPTRPYNPHFALGTALHSRVELGEKFDEQHVIAPKGIVRGGPSWQKFKAENKGKILVKQIDWDQSLAMYESIMRHSGAKELLKEGDHEESFYGQYKGIKIKGRTDFRKPGEYIVDVKTTACGCPRDDFKSYFGPASFKKSVINGKLHWQAAFYRYLAGDNHDFIFLAVEKTYPFSVSLHTLSDSLLQKGHDEVFEALEKLHHHVTNNYWPGYGNKIHTVEENQ